MIATDDGALPLHHVGTSGAFAAVRHVLPSCGLVFANDSFTVAVTTSGPAGAKVSLTGCSRRGRLDCASLWFVCVSAYSHTILRISSLHHCFSPLLCVCVVSVLTIGARSLQAGSAVHCDEAAGEGCQPELRPGTSGRHSAVRFPPRSFLLPSVSISKFISSLAVLLLISVLAGFLRCDRRTSWSL